MFPLPLQFSAPLMACLGWAALPSPVLGDGEAALRHAPEAGTSRTARLTTELTLEGGELVVVMNGDEVPAMFLPELNLDLTDRRELEVTETFRGDAWLRRYDTVGWESQGSMTMDMGGTVQEFPWSETPASPIEGRTLLFTPEDDGAVAREPADGDELEDTLLEGLTADLSLAALLPTAEDGAVAPGDTWIVSGEAVAAAWEIGREFGWDLTDEAREMLEPAFDTRSDGGRIEVHWDEVQGAYAKLSLEGSWVRTTVQPGDLTQVPVTDGRATETITETWEARGELMWDMESHQVLELSLSGDFRQEAVTVRDPDQEGPTYESTFRVDGTYSVELEVETSEEALLREEG